MYNLAIVIPAYKIEYFKRVLNSLANQTCKDFSVYIGDDCSPDPFEDLIQDYSSKLDIHYTRFEENFGGKDLVKQWERCFNLTQGEPWIWLFSDDDELDSTCVESFYRLIRTDKEASLVHFNVNVINSDSKDVTIDEFKKELFPSQLTSKEFAKLRLRYKINSFVVEYIFRRDIYLMKGGFENFDLAWCSDDATWIKFSQGGTIKTVNGSRVKWRCSESNITPNNKPEIMIRKLSSTIDYLDFLDNQFHDKTLEPLYYWYLLHALYRTMKVCDWDEISHSMKRYRANRIDILPLFCWKAIYLLLRK